MSNTKINISLKVKSQPTVNITTVDSGTLSGSALVSPTISVVATGPIGVAGPQGVQGETNIQNSSITTAKIANNAITSDKIADNTIATNDIGNQQITSAKLGTNSVTTVKITNNAVTSAKIAADAINAGHIQAGTVTRELISDGTIQGGKLEDFTVTEGKIANNSLSTIKYQERSITGAKIETNPTLTGTVTATNLTLNGNISLAGTVDGIDIASAVPLNTAKTGITSAQANNINAIKVKTDYISVTQAVNLDTIESNVSTNNSKVSFPGLGTSSSTALAGNTALLQLGTSSSTALAGNTALLALGTSSSTALAGNTTTITTGQASAISANTSKSTNVTTNLGVTTSETTVIVTSSDGNNATVPVATTSVGGVMSKAIFDQHTANVAKNTNVVTNLAITGSAAARTITSSDGTDAVIPLGTTSVSGLLSPALFDEIDANTAKVSNVAGNLTVTAVATKLQLNTSNGSNISIPAATNTAWGAMSDDLVIALEANSAKATNVVTNLSVANSTGARVIASSDGTDATIPIATASVSGVMSKAIFDEHVLNNAKNTNVVQTTISGNAATATALTTGDKDITGDLNLTGSTDKLLINNTEIAQVVSNVINIGQTNRVLKLNSSETQILSSTGVQLGHATDTTIARVSAGVVSIEGVNIQKENAHHHFIHAGFFLSFPFARYIPLNGSLNEQNTATLSPEYVNFTFPYDGFVKKMILRSETNMGSTNLKLYKGASGATVTTVLGNVTAAVGASAAVLFDFSSVSNAYSKGDTMAIKVDPTADPDGGQNITIELVFDLTT
tara:strand:+ start:13128 stop:15506 length:2379 start_codon:yes stop_codon:yes gene_type:complete